MTTTYRAAFANDCILTGPEHALLDDEALMAEALAESERGDLRLTAEEITIEYAETHGYGESVPGFGDRVEAATGMHLSDIPRGTPDDLIGGQILCRRGDAYVVTWGPPDGFGEWLPPDFRLVVLADSDGDLSGFIEPREASIEAMLQGRGGNAVIWWDDRDPLNVGWAYRIGEGEHQESGEAEWVGWAAVDGRDVEAEVAGYDVFEFFAGPDGSYLGPDQDGIYPTFEIGG